MRGGEVFLDTNVLLYLLSSDSGKADKAEELAVAGGVISVQVLNEFASVGSRKLSMPWDEIGEMLAGIRAACRVETLTTQTHDRALSLAERYGFSIYDALIVASALLAGCRALYSEDLHHGQVIERTLTIKNPFARR